MSHTLLFEHPDDLIIPESDSGSLDMLNPPRIYRASDPAQETYMARPVFISVMEEIRPQKTPTREFTFYVTLDEAPNAWFARFLGRYLPNATIAVTGRIIVVRDEPPCRPRQYARIIEDAVYDAVKDYWAEHAELLCRAYKNMWTTSQRNHWEAQIRADVARCDELRPKPSQDRSTLADTWSRYHEYLFTVVEPKFSCWKRFLDMPTLNRYRALLSLKPG